ncbi:SDHAF2 / Succinate dehydrogenase assembly factor 2 [Leishmania donovani]|nr:Flavinator of succinate dehydrogenase, putative [Leishmania donovani]CAJ1990896.1 SDHAF2 / Succinate dehydrogenase assembly factor 2 [Leishmania donovani]VDZ46747.1 Flavinator_of_succinate_dehydrogenase_putative/Pfam:PF03937 [Leishmania donovani]
MLPRLALSHGAAAAAAAVPLAVTISTASATSVSQRWCSSMTSDKPDATGANPFTSAIAKTLREKVFSQDFTAVKAATPKETELLKRWRTGDGTPEQSPRQPAAPGTADSSDVEPQIAEGAQNVAVSHGKTFRDSRPADPEESVECKRRRLIYQSRYRGMVEMDLIFGHFARCKLETLDASMLDEYDVLLKQLDSELFRWLVMGVDAPEGVAKLRCFDELRRFIKEERTELLGSN